MKPGPTRYEVNTLTALSTQLMKSQSRKGSCASHSGMGTDKRCIHFTSKSFTPGPGSYQAPSAFGQYVSKNVPNMDTILAASGVDYNNHSRSRICKTPTDTIRKDRYGPNDKRTSVRKSLQSTKVTSGGLTQSVRLSTG
jgi:hypothetical protein